MKKILLLLAVFLLSTQVSFAQDNQWFTITYKYYSGPVSPQYQKTYSIIINHDRSAEISYHQGMNKKAPQVESFTVSKTNHKKITKLIKKLGILDGVTPKDSVDGKIGGPERNMTITYGNPNPNLDQPVRSVTFRQSDYASGDVRKLFDTVEKVVPKKIWSKLEKETSDSNK